METLILTYHAFLCIWVVTNKNLILQSFDFFKFKYPSHGLTDYYFGLNEFSV